MKAAVLERVGTAGYLEQYVPVGGDERNLW